MRSTRFRLGGDRGRTYFGVLSSGDYLRENPTAGVRDQFFASGEQDMSAALDHIRRLVWKGLPRRPCDRLWLRGWAACPGHGENGRSGHGHRYLARHACRGRAELRGARGGEREVRRGCLLAERADWVNSFLVFQHIMPERGFPLLRQLLDRLRPGGGPRSI